MLDYWDTDKFKSCLEKLEPYKLQPFGILSRTLALQSPGILMFMNGELQACSYVFVYDSAVGNILKNYYLIVKISFTGFFSVFIFLCLFEVRFWGLVLGLIKSLNGLNISNNPIEFPPKDIMEKGTSEILKFLREMLQAKSSGQLLNGKCKEVKNIFIWWALHLRCVLWSTCNEC